MSWASFLLGFAAGMVFLLAVQNFAKIKTVIDAARKKGP